MVVVAAGWASFRGFPWQKSDGDKAKAVIEPFTQALRQRDFVQACALLAQTAPAKRSGTAACPSRLRAANARVVGMQLRKVDVDVDGHENGKLYISAFESGGPFDLGPVYRFTLVREDGSLRIEHIDGLF